VAIVAHRYLALQEWSCAAMSHSASAPWDRIQPAVAMPIATPWKSRRQAAIAVFVNTELGASRCRRR
jgi:hypothetical protein